jgi:hypothetical protein
LALLTASVPAFFPMSPRTWMQPESRSRRLILAFAIYVVCAATFAAVAGPARLTEHSQFNHYAHLANAWLHGRQDLKGGPPAYAMGNDFAQFEGKTYISFPPFPAVLMLPFVALAGGPDDFRDGQFVCWLAGVGPAVLFLVLEKLRRTARSKRTEIEDAALAILFAFGTVYFFTAVQGTVWFTAHVVGVAVLSLYLLFALDAEHPLLAGTMLGCAFATRPTMALAAALFALEAIRVAAHGGVPGRGSFAERALETWERLDTMALLRRWAIFAAPILAILGLMSWLNWLRFHRFDPTVGHEYLTVAWAGRIQKWGLFDYHYLAKNLGIMLTELPWLPPRGSHVSFLLPKLGDLAERARPSVAPFQINEHGLALWFTTPFYLWLLVPRRRGWLHDVTLVALLGPLAMNLLYQNSGWQQFGYRFSNDYAPMLFVLLAVGARPMKRAFACAAVWAVAWNLFGAVTFSRGLPAFDRYYFREGSQSVVYQPD